MFWRNAIAITVVGLLGMIIGVQLAPRFQNLRESILSSVVSNPKSQIHNGDQGDCQQCHSTGIQRQDRQSQSPSVPASVLFQESFADGSISLTWQTFPGFSPDLLTPIMRPDAPDGDGWVGIVTNESFGGFASLSYAGDETLSDYAIEAWIYTDVTADEQGPLNGLAIRVDPQGERFYRLAAHFTTKQELTLAYVGRDVNNFPVYLRTWDASDIPGGVPKTSGWHRMGLRAVGEQFWAYWDGKELPGGPAIDNRIQNGYFGVYANYVGARQTARTLVDAIEVYR